MNNERIQAEYNRMMDILKSARVPEMQIQALDPVLSETAWLKIKLEDTKEIMKDSEVVIPYDNGGGQKGIRENPIYKGYISLWRAYMTGIDKFTSYLPKEIKEEIHRDNISVLDQVKRMKKAKVQ